MIYTGDFLQASFDLEALSLEIQMASDYYNRIKEGTHEKISPVTAVIRQTHIMRLFQYTERVKIRQLCNM